jgi:hypothetical protein
MSGDPHYKPDGSDSTQKQQKQQYWQNSLGSSIGKKVAVNSNRAGQL